MTIALVQSNAAASSTASPTSITPTIAVSKKGTLLVLCVAVTGTSPTITAPGGWSTLNTNVANGVAYAIFYYLNNPGGITSVPVTVGGTSGGASALLLEFSTSGNFQVFDSSGSFNGTFGTFQLSFIANNTTNGELQFVAWMYTAQSISIAASQAWNIVTGAASTNGTPNAQVAIAWIQTSGAIGYAYPIATLSGQVGVIGARFPGDGNAITADSVGGLPGQLVGQFFQGMIGG